MKRNIVCALLLTLIATLTTVIYAGITLPDVILYGTMTIDDAAVTAEDDVTVIARVNGAPDPVGTYKMGARAPLGDRYGLRIRLESGADGSSQSNNAARSGNLTRIFIKQGDGPEELTAEIMVGEIGLVREVNLNHTSGALLGDMDEDGDADLDDYTLFQGCFTGSGGILGDDCDPGDFDSDNDIDLIDWRGFQAAFTGSG